MSWRIWLTGTSTGIGFQLAEQLLAAGHRLILTARQLAPMQDLQSSYPDRCEIFAVDITNKDELLAGAGLLRSRFGGLDMVILNAGTCEYVEVERFNSTVFANLMEVNFTAQCHCLEIALPILRDSESGGKIVGMVSMATYVPFPRAEAYGATKAAFQYLLESLRLDLKPDGISVTVVQPGFVDTPLTSRNDFPMPTMLSAHTAAAHIVKGLEKNRRIIVFPKTLAVILTLAACCRPLWEWVASKILVRKGVKI